MSASRRALLSILGATVAFAAIIGVASAKGGGKGGKHFDTWSSVTSRPVVSGTSPVQPKAFKSFNVKACSRDYKWLCPTKPIGKVQNNGQ